MERINGYLVIDDCEKRPSYDGKGNYFVYIDGEEYYFKFDMLAFNEVFAYNAAKFLGIEACFCDFAILNGKRGCISKSFRNDGLRVISGVKILGDYVANNLDIIKMLGISCDNYRHLEEEYRDKVEFLDSNDISYTDYVNNLDVIRRALEYRYGNSINIDEVMYQFILMYMFTIIFDDTDKHPGNWAVIESEEGVRLAALFDNEYVLSNYVGDIYLSVNFNDSFHDSIFSLQEFCKVYSCEYLNLFVSLFGRVVYNFDVILDMVVEQTGMKLFEGERSYYKAVFMKHVSSINEVLQYFKINVSNVRSKKL